MLCCMHSKFYYYWLDTLVCIQNFFITGLAHSLVFRILLLLVWHSFLHSEFYHYWLCTLVCNHNSNITGLAQLFAFRILSLAAFGALVSDCFSTSAVKIEVCMMVTILILPSHIKVGNSALVKTSASLVSLAFR